MISMRKKTKQKDSKGKKQRKSQKRIMHESDLMIMINYLHPNHFFIIYDEIYTQYKAQTPQPNPIFQTLNLEL